MGKKLTRDDFIQRSKKIHGNKYDYSLVEYKNNKTKVKIICKKHGIFEQKPSNHLKGYNCIKCSSTILGNIFFIQMSKKIHGDKYDYSLVEYKNNKTKVKIICKEHGMFEQTPNNHISKNQGCSMCSNNYNYTTKQFIKKSKEKHGNKYDYSLVEYKNNKTKVKIICKEHGMFEQLGGDHLKGSGCPTCKNSKGENQINLILNKNNINFETEKRFNDCRYKNPLPFDFYLNDYNTCIEFDGEQHFNENHFFNIDGLKIRDNIKNNYCKDNNIILYRIKYNENIMKVMKKILKDIK